MSKEPSYEHIMHYVKKGIGKRKYKTVKENKSNLKNSINKNLEEIRIRTKGLNSRIQRVYPKSRVYPKNGEYISCKNCKKSFYVTPSDIVKKRKYCCQECYMDHSGRERIRKIGLITKYKTEEEKREALLASGRKSYRKNIEKRLFYYRQLAYKRRNASGSFSKEEWEGLKKLNNFTCLHCQKKEPEIKLTIDHIIPISKWEEWIKKNPEISYECNDIENIQPLCLSCNTKKHNKII